MSGLVILIAILEGAPTASRPSQKPSAAEPIRLAIIVRLL